MSSHATVGFLAHDMGLKAEGRSLRVELLAAGHVSFEVLPRLLVSAAFALARSGEACGHAKVVSNLIPESCSTHGLRHALFTVPFLWDGPEIVRVDDVMVAWLLLVPLSDGERDYATEYGVAALEEIFRREEINVFDLRRPSAV